jgi:hypothetical protein
MIPVVDDTRSAEEVEVSVEIQAKADELNGDPVAIYEYVKNNFELEMYNGILKGAPDAYRQRSGSSADLAAVLTRGPRIRGRREPLSSSQRKNVRIRRRRRDLEGCICRTLNRL